MTLDPEETAALFENWCIDNDSKPGDEAFVMSLALTLDNFRREGFKAAGVYDDTAPDLAREYAAKATEVIFGNLQPNMGAAQ